MEQVLNAKERNKAFMRFIAFLIPAIMLIVAAVYFDYRIPLKENDLLREKIRGYENQFYYQQEFVTNMEDTKNLIDSFGRLEQFNALMDREIARQLDQLTNPVFKDSNWYGRMNKDIFNVFYDYNELNKKLLQSKGNLQQAEHLKNELNQCQSNLAEVQRSLDVYRNSGNLGLSN